MARLHAQAMWGRAIRQIGLTASERLRLPLIGRKRVACNHVRGNRDLCGDQRTESRQPHRGGDTSHDHHHRAPSPATITGLGGAGAETYGPYVISQVPMQTGEAVVLLLP